MIDKFFLKIFDAADEIPNSFHNFGNVDICIQDTRGACRTGFVTIHRAETYNQVADLRCEELCNTFHFQRMFTPVLQYRRTITFKTSCSSVSLSL